MTGVQGYKTRHLPPTFEMEENNTGETHAKVEGNWYWVTDGTTWTCCFCCGTYFLHSDGSTVTPVDVVMISCGLALAVFENCNAWLHFLKFNGKKLALP